MAGPNNGTYGGFEPPIKGDIGNIIRIDESGALGFPISPRPVGSAVKPSSQTEAAAKAARAEGQAPESGFLMQFWNSPVRWIALAFLGLVILRRIVK